MPEVGPAGACAIVPVGGGTHDFRDHGDAADAGHEAIGRAHREEVAVQIRAPLPWIKEINGFCAEERFEGSHEGEHDQPFRTRGAHDPGEVGMTDAAEHVQGKRYQILRPDGILMAVELIHVLMRDIEVNGERGGHEKHEHGARNGLYPAVLHEETAEEQQQGDSADEGDFRVQVGDAVRDFRKEFERFAGMGGDAESDVNLLGDDDDADGGEHAVHGGHREEFAEGAEAQRTEKHLEDACQQADGERLLVSQFLNAAEHNDNHSRSGPLDGKFRVAQEGSEHPSDHGGEDAGNGRHSRRDRDAETERQGDQEDKKARKDIVFPVGGEADQIACGLGSSRNSGGGRSRVGHGGGLNFANHAHAPRRFP